MKILDIIPLTRIPSAQPQILSYFSGQDLPLGALVQIPLGRRTETGMVFDSHEAADLKMEIKKAGYELKPIKHILGIEPVLTTQQIELALWLGQYYFAPPGIFLRMMMPRSKQQPIINSQRSTKKSQKLIIVPTISMVKKMASHHPNHAFWHSELTSKQQNEIWRQIKNGQARTIVGTRSTIFLPFANLKEITIEDETNPAHRSWDMFPHYRTHEAAQKIAEIFNAKLLIKSGVPSFNSYDIRYRKFTISDIVRIIDMRQELKDGNFSIFSRALQAGIKNSLAQKSPVILFVNRRGAANFILCRDCGYVAKCQNCDAPLAYHLINAKPMLLCHRCGHKEAPPDLCPKCQSHRVKTVGAGTQKVELEAQKLYPHAKILRLDSDTAPDAKTQQKIIEDFVKKEAVILVSTQIIFSWLEELKSARATTVALISADTLLHLPDFNSGERTFQAIMALQSLLDFGHSEFREAKQKISRECALFIQTYNPASSTVKYAAAGDWESFCKEEMEARQLLDYPPFSQIVKLTFRHRDPQKAGQEAKILAAKLQRVIASVPQLRDAKQSRTATADANKNNYIELSAPLPAFIPKVKSRFVWNIIIKFKISKPETKMSNEFLQSRNSLLKYIPSNWEIDINPVDLL